MSFAKHASRLLKGLRLYRVPLGVTSRVVKDYFSSLDCPRSLAAWLLYENREHEQLAKLRFDPLAYNSVGELRDAYAATEFLSKFKDLTLDYDLDEVAMQKFEKFELLCKRTNARFQDLSRDPLFTGRAVWLHSAVIRKIERILGAFSAEEFLSSPDWGPGASTLIKRREASPEEKFRRETGITQDLYDLVPYEFLEKVYPLWASQLRLEGFPSFQVGNKVITVPKDAKANRVIAIEPGINLFFQKSVGEMIRRRLRRCGVDLRFQARNQELARVGSITNHLATIDLSSASDSIASAVVEELIPPRWLTVMDACRSHYGVQGTQVRKWSKFSSMGNGFTFELESLIFYAIATSCAEYLHISTTDVSVYGDDIILPSTCFGLFSEMMRFYGFLINEEKSHIDSPFRESCGGHFVSGVDVKPLYLKDSLLSAPAVYRLANAVRRLAHRRNNRYGCDVRLKKTFEHLVSLVPAGLRLRIPETLGDGGFISNFDEATPSKAGRGFEGFRVLNFVAVGVTHEDDSVGYLLSSLWRLARPRQNIEEAEFERRQSLGELLFSRGDNRTRLKAFAALPRDVLKARYNSVVSKEITRFRVANSLVHQWYDLGPWY
jgi:hypothetical protein